MLRCPALQPVLARPRCPGWSHAHPLTPFSCLLPSAPGVYIATMMATVQTLQEKGHPYSEICNEVGAARALAVDGCGAAAAVGGRG